MKTRSSLFRAAGRDAKSGQMVVIFALCLIAIIAMAGLLIDGGNAWAQRRLAQSAADTAALAGAVARSNQANAAATAAAARTIAAANGFGPGNLDCSGNALPNGGVTVNWPPTSGPHSGDTGFVEVYTTRSMHTAFAGVVGQPCWLVSARAVASVLTQVATCSFCSLSDWQGDDRYVLLIDNGNDLRVDGDIFSNHATWYGGVEAVNRCSGANPCTAATCHDAPVLPFGGQSDNIRMCGHSIYVDHSGGATPTILSAKTIAAAGGWQARSKDDIIHADQTVANCVAHPRNLNYPAALQETNVCIGTPQIVDPLNDPGNPSAIMPIPDYANLSTCPGGPTPCGPVASATCVAEAGSTLRLPTGTQASPVKLIIGGAGDQGVRTICPGIYYGGLAISANGAAQPHVIMLPGTYVMFGGGFSINGGGSITSVSSQGDGVSIYNTGGNEALSESFPSDPLLVPAPCTVGLCQATGTTTFNPPGAPIQILTNVQYKLILGTSPGISGTVAFYNGSNPITCTGGAADTPVITANSLTAKCTTQYNLSGTKGITALYSGDANYAPKASQKSQVVNPAAGTGQQQIDIRTDTTQPCSAIWNPVTNPCARVNLHAPTSGRYSGLLFFQDRAPGLTEPVNSLLIQPALGAAACDMTLVGTPLGSLPRFMVDGNPAAGAPYSGYSVPAPCGPLGGLSGTIYASHTAGPGPGVASDWDTAVDLKADGLANIQIIGAEIFFTQGNPSHQARFAFDASLFANGKVRLVE